MYYIIEAIGEYQLSRVIAFNTLKIRFNKYNRSLKISIFIFYVTEIFLQCYYIIWLYNKLVSKLVFSIKNLYRIIKKYIYNQMLYHYYQ